MYNTEKILLALANKHLLPEFEEMEDIENPRFIVEGAETDYPKLKFKAEVDFPDEENLSEDELNKFVKEWLKIEDEVQNKVREIEDRFEEDFMIYSFVDRKR